MQDLERRLNDLGNVISSANVVSATTNKPSASAVTPQTGKNNPLLVSKGDVQTLFYNCPLSHQLLLCAML